MAHYLYTTVMLQSKTDEAPAETKEKLEDKARYTTSCDKLRQKIEGEFVCHLGEPVSQLQMSREYARRDPYYK